MTFGGGPSLISPSEPASRTTRVPAITAPAVTRLVDLLASEGSGASGAARIKPMACSWPSSITIGEVTAKPGGSPVTSMEISPSNPSIRSARKRSSLPLPAPTAGFPPPARETLKSGTAGRAVNL